MSAPKMNLVHHKSGVDYVQLSWPSEVHKKEYDEVNKVNRFNSPYMLKDGSIVDASGNSVGTGDSGVVDWMNSNSFNRHNYVNESGDYVPTLGTLLAVKNQK